MHEYMKPKQITNKFLSPGVLVLIALAVNGLIFLALRFLFGLGAVTNLDNQHPWGIWIAIDVAVGVALAAGGFTSAALGHIMHKENYHVIVRPALLTAMLGYTFVAMGVAVDLGRYYDIWHVMLPPNWNGNSALFEVGMCVMIYVSVLYIEFLPIVCERFIGKVNLPGFLAKFNVKLDNLLKALDRGLDKTMFIFIIAGVVLSCLHQSSLGTLMIIAGPKMHPLWQTPVLPLLFLLSAISVGFPMVIFESLLASRSFKLKPEMDILARLGNIMPPLLGIYLAFKIGDMVIRESFVYLNTFSVESVSFIIEIMIGFVIPLRIFLSRKLSKTPLGLFIASSMVISGVIMNRVNNFLIAYNPPFAEKAYYPSIGEISVTVGLIAIEILLYRAFVKIFPIISLPHVTTIKAKYTIKGMAK